MNSATDTAAAAARRRLPLGRLALLWLTGADLRLTMLAVPPVLPLIHHDLALSEKAIGALSGLPVLLIGVAAVPGSLLIARLGPRRAAICALIVVAAAAAARGIGSSAFVLFATTAVMGVGVALLQPTLPTLVSLWFEAAPGFATAVYANGLVLGEALPAALTIPFVLPLVGGSWGVSLAVWAAPAALAALLLAVATRHVPRPVTAPAGWWPDWKNPLTWQLGLMLSGSGGLYYSLNTFIPGYLHAIGRPGLVAACLAALNLSQLPASAMILVAARHLTANRAVLMVMPPLILLSLAAFLAPISWLSIAGAGALGFFGAFVLILSLALPPLLVPPEEVHRLSAGMFTLSYPLSFLFPLAGGALWDATAIPTSAFIVSAVAAVVIFVAALTVRMERTVA
ncbi:MAG: CynX/NimT family MFS transporter [Stellaceae bacterium]